MDSLFGSPINCGDKRYRFDLFDDKKECCVDLRCCDTAIPDPRLQGQWADSPVQILCTATASEDQLQACCVDQGVLG